MIRVITAVVLLLAIPLLALMCIGYMENVLHDSIDLIADASQAAANDDWEQAVSRMEASYRRWTKERPVFALLVHQSSLNSVERSFSVLREAVSEKTIFRMECAALMSYLHDQVEDCQLQWTHVL